jgi:hypothetical protein
MRQKAAALIPSHGIWTSTPCGQQAFRAIMVTRRKDSSIPLPMSAWRPPKIWPRTRMSSAPDAINAAVIEAFSKIPTWLERSEALVARGRFLDCDCLLGPVEQPFHVAIRAGRIVDLTPAPVLMRSWRFSYRATSLAWAQHWQPMPRPGWHDLLALTKRGEAALEGDIHPFMTNLQYFKDVLALPRQYAKVAA